MRKFHVSRASMTYLRTSPGNKSLEKSLALKLALNRRGVRPSRGFLLLLPQPVMDILHGALLLLPRHLRAQVPVVARTSQRLVRSRLGGTPGGLLSLLVPSAPVGLLDAAADGRPPAAGGRASHLGSLAHLSRSSYALLFNLPGISVQRAPAVLRASICCLGGRGEGCTALKTLLIDYGQGAVAAGLPGLLPSLRWSRTSV